MTIEEIIVNVATSIVGIIAISVLLIMASVPVLLLLLIWAA